MRTVVIATALFSFLGASVAEAAFIRRGKIKRKQTAGYKVVVVVGDDAANNEVNTVDVSIPHVEGQPTPAGGTTFCDDVGTCETTVTLPLKVKKANGNKRFVFKDLTFSEDAVNFSYTMTATMKDALDAPVGVPVTMTLDVEDDGDSRVRTVALKQLDERNFALKVVVVGDAENQVATASVKFADFSGPTPIPAGLSMSKPAVNGGKKIFEDTVTFDDPSSAADEVYNVVVDLRGADGASLGSSQHDIVVEGLDPGDLVSCHDGIQNGDETAPDCGGSICAPCPAQELVVALVHLDGSDAGEAVIESDENGPDTLALRRVRLAPHTRYTTFLAHGNRQLGSLPVQFVGEFTTDRQGNGKLKVSTEIVNAYVAVNSADGAPQAIALDHIRIYRAEPENADEATVFGVSELRAGGGLAITSSNRIGD